MTDQPLIPRQVLFDNPRRIQPRLSPDGVRMSYLAPKNGVLNVWACTIGRDDDRVVTRDTQRDILSHEWAYDNAHILYLQDTAGDENFHVHAVNPDSREVRDLTLHDGVKAEIIGLDPVSPDAILITMNRRDERLMDPYRIVLSTGETTRLADNPGHYVGWFADNAFRLRGAYAAMPDGGFQLLVRDGEQDAFRPLVTWSPEETGVPYGFTPDGRGVYIADNRGSDLTRLQIVDVATGATTDLATHERVDVDGVIIHPTGHHVQAVSFNLDRPRWTILDDRIKTDIERIEATESGAFDVVSRDLADETWLVAFTADVTPVRYYSWNRTTQSATFLFDARPDLQPFALSTMDYLEVPARDGLCLPCYLSLPPGTDPHRSGSPLPLVLDVHGGPWHRDEWGFTGEVQWLANRGYAVLQVNFRGSTGFGKTFLHSGDKEWGRRMQHDLTDAVKWAVDRGLADPKRLGILGGSYGGYAVLAAAAFTPELFACGVDIVGPSSIITLLDSIPPYWEPLKNLWTVRVGDPESEREMLLERSPLTHVDKMVMPLLIAQGANDPRVKQAESEQIVAALEAKGKDVQYALYADEGHGFVRPENRIDFYAKAERFLARHLGGRFEE